MLKSQTDANGNPLLRGKHIQGKCMAKTANLMFKEFVKRFVVKLTLPGVNPRGLKKAKDLS